MTMAEAIKAFYGNYVNFEGRSPRSALWWVILYILLVVAAVMGLIALMTPPIPPNGDLSGSNLAVPGVLAGAIGLFYLANLIPYIALVVRRLHDIDKSGWFILINFVPLVGPIILLVFFCTKGTAGTNRFGPDPLVATANVF